MASKVAMGIIPVPVEESVKLISGTPLTELLADHVVDFIQLSTFVDGLSYWFLKNVPLEEYNVYNAHWLNIVDHLKRYEKVDKSKLFTVFPVILVQDGSKLEFLPVKPLEQLTWSDIDELLTRMEFKSCLELDKWKLKFDSPKEWVVEEMEIDLPPAQEGGI